MPARAISAAAEEWAAVAKAVSERRVALDLTAEETVEAAGRGLSLTVLSLIENCRQTSYSVRTLAALCRALRWTPDSIERILIGGKPVEATHTKPNHSNPRPLDHPDVLRRLEELEDEIRALRAELGRD